MSPAPGLSTEDEPPTIGSTSPLQMCKNEASFDWERMRLNIEDAEQLSVKWRVWRMLEKNPLFKRCPLTVRTSEEEKRLTGAQLVAFHHSGVFDNIHTQCYKTRTRYIMSVNEATNMYSPSLSVKFALGVSLFANAILSLGTERHKQFYQDVWDGKILSCLALTELAHGSDTKHLRTIATYDPPSRQFILHTPDHLAAKCWVGNLGMQCTHALLFAQLWTGNTCHGLHAFIVPVRDPDTLLPYPGCTIGDMGEKIGLHGIDNGFIFFDHYRIPKENLLNRIGDVTEDGEYETSFTDPQRILGAALENLSAGRVAIMQESCNKLACAVTIAVRYAAVRTQFCDVIGRELPLLHYQLHQYRLFKHLAAAYILKVFVRDFTDQYLDCVVHSRDDSDEVKNLMAVVSGVHAVVCCSKPLVTWATAEAVQESREACGGNGFLKAAGLGDLRNNHDPTVTYEGDNNVLLQQTSNWLLRQARELPSQADGLVFPLSLIGYLASGSALRATYRDQPVTSHNFVEEAFNWLVQWLLQSTQEKVSVIVEETDRFTARNHSQVFYAHTLSIAFAQNNVLKYFWNHCEKTSEPELRSVLEKLYFLYGLTCLQKHIGYLYQGGYCKGPAIVDNLNTAVLRLLTELRPEAVSLVEALAPPDFILNSVLARSDGKLYDNLMDCLTSKPGAMERPSWWREIRLKAKL